MQLLLRRLWIQITADRKRFIVLCLALAVGLLLWARLIVTSNLPRTAVAGDPVARAADATPPSVPQGSDNPPRPTVRVRLAHEPKRDPLLISERHFPKPTPVEMLPQDDPKSSPDTAENGDETEARLTEELRAMVRKFRLEAVMQGKPMAVINGKTYPLHGWIPAVDNRNVRFQLVEVAHRSVVLECRGRRFKLKMEYPG